MRALLTSFILKTTSKCDLRILYISSNIVTIWRATALSRVLFRIEYNNLLETISTLPTSSDISQDCRQNLSINGLDFICPDWPYAAMFMLDRILAAEHVASKAVDAELSREICDWGYAERAAAGMTWVNPPLGFRFRTMLPLCRETQVLAKKCWVFHIPGNYTNTEKDGFPLGRIPIDEIFGSS